MNIVEHIRATSLIDSNGCWLPKRAIRGYRHVRVDGVLQRAHRAVVGAKSGDIVLHTCDVPSCCNPAHLTIGTQADNMLDMQTKGRHPSRKLSDEDVAAILESSDSGYSLAKKFGVSKSIIYRIRKGEIYVRLRQNYSK